MRNNLVALTLIVFSIVVFSGCKTLGPVKTPAGFAAYDGTEPFRAVTSDGVMYRVRTAENKPFAELDFWKTAMKKHLTESGYRFIAEKDITADTLKGYQIELAAPSGEKDYTYLISVFVKDNTLIIAEASGEITVFKKHRKAIDEAVGKIQG